MDLRASDADRQRVAALLQRHTAAGRLSLDEFTERVSNAYAARTLSQLAATTEDLPAVVDADDNDDTVTERDQHQHDARQLAAAFGIALLALILLGACYLVLT